MYKILIIEDDKGIQEAVCKQEKNWDIKVKGINDFRNVLKEFAEFDPHLVLLDISLPFFNGYHWCTQIRKESSVPIIFISSAGDDLNIITAMNMGADDFIVKPFDLSVLIAKMFALLRRTYDFRDLTSIVEHKGVMLNTSDNTLNYNGEKIELTKNEYRILLTLMISKGKIVSREKLMEKIWETDNFIDENALNVNVSRLRRKLEDAGLQNFIQTKFGLGYIVEE